MTFDHTSFHENLISLKHEQQIAVALSGGGDSMALAHLLAHWCKAHKIKLHILHVNHNLRSESKTEAQTIKAWVKSFPHFAFKILTWTHPSPIKNKILEQARTARYELLSNYCAKQKINHLMIAHHADDQAETILFRIAKSSGIDGLSGIKPVQPYNNNLLLHRPLLQYTHNDLIEYCQTHALEWIEDPSNKNDKFARPRLRQAKSVLEKEGLTTTRLLTLAKRMARARDALEEIATDFYKTNATVRQKGIVAFDYTIFKNQNEEMIIRVLNHSINALYPKRTYPVPLENLEIITSKIKTQKSGRTTIAKCLISWSKTSNSVVISKENII